MNNSIILDEILDSQRSPNDKSGLGYNKEFAHSEVGTSKKHNVGPSFSKGEIQTVHQATVQRKGILRRSKEGRHQESFPTPQSKFIREMPSTLTKKHKYENKFHGQFFSCNEYGNKYLDCRHYERKYVRIFNNILRVLRCNLIGHIVAHCHTMRCYNCSGFGHKSEDCWNKRRQSMRNDSYNMEIRSNETWNNDNVEIMEDQRTSTKKLGHSQRWMNNIEQQDMNEGIKNDWHEVRLSIF
jgi:hypothetical protein